ncbi:MAG: glycosyltransferase family 4 protein [Pyrinomonadaceae bacterium]|nr:glycosyltransferase family 4 protein [Pyrinomonadaceae bacterium]
MKVLLLNQCFYPDVVATAQLLTHLAVGLAEKGHQVTVIAGDRGYDDPATRFVRRERWQGITIIRIPSFALGKHSKWRRAVNFASFLINCSLRLLLLPQFDVVVALTSPPLISLLGSLFVRIKGGRFVFWVMDLNPDEAIAAGWLKENSLAGKILKSVLRYSLRHATCVIVLDRFMKERILKHGTSGERITVLPPWAHGDAVCFDEAGRRAFRERHNLSQNFVVMYAGNHSPCHPLNTLLEAALRLSERSEIAFCFVGGGTEQARVKAFAAEHKLNRISSLPYQPLKELGGSLSAADLHTVVMGDGFSGIVHPCKVYNILSVGTPFLYIGPPESYVTDIAAQATEGFAMYSARHGEVDRVVAHILKAAEQKKSLEKGNCSELASKFAKDALLPRMIQLLESEDGCRVSQEAGADGRRQEKNCIP